MDARSPRGTNDILPGEARIWQRVERAVAEVMTAYDYREIRTPVFEHTELFTRGVGETTDIVEKQMYSFVDRGGRSVTLRPEGTAPVVRAFLQHHLYGNVLPQKLWYIQPMFRYERPQAGRGRQFHQFGAEALGSLDPACDVEMIAIPMEVYRRLGIYGHEVLLNSIGCPVCRPDYRKALRDDFKDKLETLCRTCRNRYERNPLRILDCKVEGCRMATEAAPAGRDHLCDECGRHLEAVTRLLEVLGIGYRLDNRLVRGLDYYTKTVFEIVTDALGAQDALAAGGRYDGLTEEIGGPRVAAVGFGAGLERAVMMLQKLDAGNLDPEALQIFVVSLGEQARLEGVRVAHQLRRAGIATSMDYKDASLQERSLRGQMKAANRSGAVAALILGEDEVSRGVVTLRSMVDGAQREVATEKLVETVVEELGGGRAPVG